jgi:hypothetical protein
MSGSNATIINSSATTPLWPRRDDQPVREEAIGGTKPATSGTKDAESRSDDQLARNP